MQTLPDTVALETTACPLCDCDRPLPYRTAGDILYGMPGEFQMVRCGACGHIYLNPRPAPECIAQFYPEHYGPFHLRDPAAPGGNRPGDAFGASGPRPWYLSPVARSVPGLRSLYYWLTDTGSDYIPEVASNPRRALELGCADGSFLARLRDLGWEAEGVELCEEPAQRAAARGFAVHRGALESAQFPDAHFDAIFAWMVVEHLHDPRGTLHEVRRVLKPSGWLAFSVPNIACWEPKAFGRYWYSLQLPTHLQHYSPRTLRALLKATGFDLVRIVHQRNVLNLVGSLGIWLRVRFPGWGLGQRLISFTDNPGLWGQLALAPLAKVLAWARQGGRLTVIARAGSQWPEGERPVATLSFDS